MWRCTPPLQCCPDLLAAAGQDSSSNCLPALPFRHLRPAISALQIAACPEVTVVSAADVSPEVLEREKAIEMEKEDIKSKPEAMRCVPAQRQLSASSAPAQRQLKLARPACLVW